MKFEEGDILEFNKGRAAYSANDGAQAIFTGKFYTDRDGGELIEVKWVRNGDDNEQNDGEYYSSMFTKVEEEVTQKEDRIFEENKKAMKFNFEEGKQRVITMMMDRVDDFTHDMFQDIRSVINEDRDETLDQIEEIIESIRFTKRDIENATEQVKSATSIQEVLEAMNDTMFEGMEETVLGELFNVDFIVE